MKKVRKAKKWINNGILLASLSGNAATIIHIFTPQINVLIGLAQKFIGR